MSGGRWAVTMFLVTAALSVLAGSSAASASLGFSRDASRQTCGPDAATTLVDGRLGRVYEFPVPSKDEDKRERATFACLFGLGRAWRLDRVNLWMGRFDVLDPSMIVLHAPWVAYSQDFWAVDTGELFVAAKNLRSGRSYLCPVGPWSSAAGIKSELAGIVLTRTGRVGWIAQKHESSGSNGEVAACDSAGFKRLDNGEGIDLESLRLLGSRMTWTDSGAERSTVLR